MRELLIDLLQAINLVMQSGEELTDEFQMLLAETLERVMAQSNIGGSITPPRSIERGMPSSNVKGMEYDPRSGNMFVQFLGKHPNQEGPIYQYPKTPREIAELLQDGAIPARTDGKNKWGRWWKGKTPSAGASVYTLLKNRNVPYQKIT